MDELRELQERNEKIALKFQKIEEKIVSSESITELFETLILQIEEEFEIPFVWLSIVDKPDLSDLIRLLQSSKIVAERLNVIEEQLFLDLTGRSEKPVLVNEGLKPFYSLMPRNNIYLIRSLAVAPIAVSGAVIGSVNHGDSSATRYDPSMDTALLSQMTAKVSACLTRLLPPAG